MTNEEKAKAYVAALVERDQRWHELQKAQAKFDEAQSRAFELELQLFEPASALTPAPTKAAAKKPTKSSVIDNVAAYCKRAGSGTRFSMKMLVSETGQKEPTLSSYISQGFLDGYLVTVGKQKPAKGRAHNIYEVK